MKNNLSVEYEENGFKMKEVFKPSNRIEEEENYIAKENAKLIFKPKFIPFYPNLKIVFDLSWLETIIYGFVDFYLSNSDRNRFYFTNNQLSEVTGADVSDTQISLALKRLREKGLLNCKYKIKAGGGKIRFIDKLPFPLNKNLKLDFNKSLSGNLKKVKGNNNKINNNKINNIYTLFLEEFNKITNKKHRILDSKARRQLKTRLSEGYRLEDVYKAIKNCMMDEFHKESNYKYLTPEFITRSDKLEKFLQYIPEVSEEEKYEKIRKSRIEETKRLIGVN